MPNDNRPQNAKLQPGKHTQGLLRPAPLLEPGEVTDKVRVRCKLEVMAWFSGLTPLERGAIVEAAMIKAKNA